MSKKLGFAIALVFCLCAVAEGQFIGYTSPQTVSQILATNVTCTGALQNFSVSNLAQSSHVVNFTTSGQNVQVSLNGSWDGVNFLQFSDTAMDASGQLQATGYYPALRVSVLCAAASGTFSVQYSGTSSYQVQPIGFLDRTAFSKLLAANLASNTNSGNLVATVPYASAAGVLLFSGSVPAGSTFTLTSQGDATAAVTLLNAVVLQTGTVITQPFLIPNMPASQVTFSYTSGGASAGTYNVQILFFKPGVQLPSSDPCQSQWGTLQKVSTAVTVGAATTAQVGNTPATGLSIYVCSYQITQAVAAGTVQWVSGTGANCSVGTSAVTGAVATSPGQPIIDSGSGFVLKVTAGNSLCLTTTGAGATAAGSIVTVIAP